MYPSEMIKIRHVSRHEIVFTTAGSLFARETMTARATYCLAHVHPERAIEAVLQLFKQAAQLWAGLGLAASVHAQMPSTSVTWQMQ